jgi:hypothetical protein
VLTTPPPPPQHGTKRKPTGALLSNSAADADSLRVHQTQNPNRNPSPQKQNLQAGLRKVSFFLLTKMRTTREEQKKPKRRPQKERMSWMGVGVNGDDADDDGEHGEKRRGRGV